MKLARTVVNAMVVAALGFGAAGLGTGMASAKPGHGNDIDRPCFPFCENRHDWNEGQAWNDFDRGHSDKGPWWANNRHDWWDDRKVRHRGAGAHRLHISGTGARRGRSTTGATT